MYIEIDYLLTTFKLNLTVLDYTTHSAILNPINFYNSQAIKQYSVKKNISSKFDICHCKDRRSLTLMSDRFIAKLNFLSPRQTNSIRLSTMQHICLSLIDLVSPSRR